jgi:RHS repeat-associated protein
VYVPVSRQEFDNGFVGLYPQGGILEAESDGGPVQVLIEPGAIPTITRDGDHMEIPADLSIPVDVSELNLPDGVSPEEGVYGLCAVSRVDGQIAYHLLDDMEYEDGKLVTRSFPFFQLLIGGVFTLWETAAIVNGVPPTPSQPDPPRLPDPNPAESAVQQISLVMINFPLSRKVRVQGTVIACDVDSGNSCDSRDPANPRVAGAVVTFRSLNQSLGSALKGRLDAGAVFAVSDKNGKYALIADNPTLLDPIGNIDDDEGFLALTATHPRYFGQRPARSVDLSATSNVGIADLAFSFAGSSGPNTSPPFISASHTPANPGTNDVVEFTVLATHGASQPGIQAPQVLSVTSLLPDIQVQPSDITITGPVSQQNPGGFGRQEVFEIESTKAAIAILQVEAAVPNSQPRQLRYALAFGGEGAPGTNAVQVVDDNDTVGPQVEATLPSDNSLGIVPGQTITIVFSEPVDAGITNSTTAIQISPSVTAPTFELSRDQRELSFVLYDVNPETDYSITLSSSIMDLAGNSFDQDPSTAANDSYTMVLRTAPVTAPDEGQFAEQSRGGGVVIKGIHAFALERAGTGGNALLVHDLSNPNAPQLLARLPLPGYPRDLALIPDYSFVRKPGAPVERKDLLAVVGGDLGAAFDDDGNVAFAGQYLRLIDISDPASPKRLASRNITLSPAVAVTKIQWAPPVMAYLEFGIVCTDNVFSSQCIPNQQIGLVDLQSFIIGEFLTQEEFRELPPDPTPGEDLNGDGDYVDPGETLPLPGSRPFEFAGKVGAITLDDSTQAIRDFEFDTSTGHLSVVLGDGKEVAPDGSIVSGTFRNPSFRILISGGSRIAAENWSLSSVEFPGLRPKRVFARFGVPLVTDDESRTADLAFVSVVPASSDANKIVVIDVTNPLSLTVLTEIEVDPNLGLVQSITEREDGMLRLATSHNIMLIDPGRLNLPVVAGQSHPAVVGFIPRAGSGNQTLSGNLAGLNVVSLGGNNRVVQSAPWMQFVRAVDGTNVINPESIVGDTEGITDVLSRIAPADVIVPARHRTVTNVVTSTLDPPQAIGHYHLLVAAPGSAGPTISLSLESLNRAGFPLRNKGLGFPAVRAMSSEGLTQIGQTARDDCDVPMQALTAFRLSTNKSDANFNLYLSRPFALIYESISSSELQALQSSLNREILWSGHFLRASLDISLSTNVVLAPFVGELDADKKVIRPGVSVIARSLPADYIMGPNPPPHLGHDALPGTFNSVSGHNGEFRTDTVDIQLSSRRMPVRFERFVGSQDLYDGPFGRGWDFNYNQRLVEIDLSIVPEGYQVPLVITGSGGGELAQARDVLFHNGEGRIVWYRYAGEEPPPEYENDPLAKELDWLDRADAFYLPPPGVFDMLVRFPSGQFARLTPDGTQYWYSALGRLDKIHDKYPKNEIRLEYNSRGDLRRVTDESVVADRFVEVGYWRLQNDIDSALLDQSTSNPYIAGKIARLRDYTDRNIDFFYDECGVLTNRLGVDVTFSHPSGFTGRQSTTYVQPAAATSPAKANGIRGIVSGSGAGTALFMADMSVGSDVPEVTGGQAAGSAVTVDMQHENTASDIASGNGKTVVSGAAGAVAEFLFDTNGLPKEVKYSGPIADAVVYKYAYRDDGLLERITYPANNAVELTYSTSDNLRSRANVEKVKKIAGPDGGDPIPDAAFDFDENYNLIVGTFTDHNGNDITVELTNDKRDIRKFSYPGAGEETFSFNEYGQLLTFTSIDGVEHEYDYDPVSGFLKTRKEGGLVTTFIYGGGASDQRGLPSAIQPPRGAPYSATYDERDQLITWERGQQREQFSYDQNGNVVRMARRVDGSEEYVETSEYLQNGFLEKHTIEQLETDGSVQTLVTRFEPDSAFRIARIILPDGEEQTFQEFDHLGQPHKMTLGSYEEKYTYDANNNLLTVTIGNAVHQYGYDGHDRLITEERPTGTGASEMVEYSYHGAGVLKTLTLTDSAGELNQDISIEIDSYNRPRIVTIQTDDGAVQNIYSYDGTSRTTTLTTPSNETYTQTYDAAGRVKTSSDSLQTTTYTHDDNGNLERASMQEGLNTYQRIFTPINSLDQSERFADDLGTVFSIVRRLDGRAKSVTDALNHLTSYDYTKMGELTLEDRPEGVSIKRDYNKHRALASLTDTSDQGLTYSYDTTLRLESVRHRDNQSTTYGGFNARNQPTSITMPGGSITVGYDQQGRVVSRAINFLGEQRNESFTYDALSRYKTAAYPIGNVSLDYDLMGPLRKQTFTHNGFQYVVDRVLRNDGAILGTSYPSGVTVSQTRNTHGRLGGVFPSSGAAVVQQTTYAAADLVESMTLGDGLIRVDNQFDARKRLLGRQYIRIPDGEVLADVRSVYDAVDNRVAQQFVHRGGRIDFFQYDEGDRLTRADVGARPAISVAGLRIFPGFSVPSGVSGSWSAGFYARDYNYDNLGLDVLQSVAEINPQGVTTPPFGSSYGLPDTLLHIQNIDGFTRSRDNLGNTRRALLSVRLPGNGGVIDVGADLVYDGKSQLVRVLRDDGVQIDYEYQHDGLRCYRTVTGPPDRCVAGATAYVYDGDLLIEEWDRSLGESRLSIRYYYADTIVPLAADFRMADDSFERHYFLSDSMGSVIGLANEQAEVIERYVYDPYGQPRIEGIDQVAPRVAQLVMGDGGSLILVFSEPVLPPLTATGTGGLVSQLSPLPGTVTVNCGGQADQGAIVYDEALSGFEFGSVLVFLPQFPIEGGCVVNIEAGRLRDEWGNLNAAEQIAFTASPTSGTVVYDDSDFLTRAPVLSRSGIGSTLLFHGEQFDYEAGLLYLRARFHDPATGLFLQQDPRAYEDSVNPYAGFAHNPMTFSDPSGEATVKVPITSRGAAVVISPKSTPAAVPKLRIPDNPNIPVAKSSKVIPVKASGSRVNNTPASAAKSGQKSVRAAEPQQRLASQTPDQTTRPATKLDKPTQEQVRAMIARGRRIETELHNFAVQEQINGRLKIVYKDLGEIKVEGRNISGKMGGHRYDPATDTSVVTVNSRLSGDPMLDAKASSTLIHELSHAREALATRSMSAKGVPRFQEELGAHLDQVAFELAKFGKRMPFSSAVRNHYLRGGKDAVGHHIFEKSPTYQENFGAKNYDQLVELNPLLFGRGQRGFE